jgi:superoxide dismutase, Cu-Zn family
LNAVAALLCKAPEVGIAIDLIHFAAYRASATGEAPSQFTSCAVWAYLRFMKTKFQNHFALTVLSVILACSLASHVSAQETKKAIAVLNSASGSQVKGTVTFTQVGDTIQVVADVTGLAPGKYGFHIHEFGDCSAADASSAGGHFNPMKKPHGAPDAAERHAGDLGNLEADSTGKAHLELKDNMLKLSGENSILGRGVIVHEKVDDWSQPTGNAGGRQACGVIGIAKP